MQGSTHKLGKHDAGLPQPRGVQVSYIDLTLNVFRSIVFAQCNLSCMRTVVADQTRLDPLKHACLAISAYVRLKYSVSRSAPLPARELTTRDVVRAVSLQVGTREKVADIRLWYVHIALALIRPAKLFFHPFLRPADGEVQYSR